MENTPVRVWRLQNGLAALIMALYFAIAWQSRVPTDLQGSDELEYRALSQSLEHGSYREIFQATEPLAVKYPPVYPSFLLAIRTVAGDHADAVRLANIVLMAIALILRYLAVRQFAGGWVALGALLVSAVNPSTFLNASSQMSESLYFTLVTAAMYATFRAERGSTRAIPAVMVFTVLAFLTRTAGITLIVAIWLWFFLRRPRRELAIYSVVALIALGAWFGYTASVPHDGAASYTRDLSDAHVGASTSGIVRIAKHAVSSWYALSTRTAVYTLALPTVEGTIADNVLWVLVIFVLVPIGVIALWRRWTAMSIYVVLYSLLMVVWPYPSGRLLSAIIPTMIVAVLLGAKAVFLRAAPRATSAALIVLVFVFVLGAMQRDIDRSAHLAGCDRAHPLDANGCHNSLEHGMIHASDYLKTNARPTDVLVTSKGATMYFLSDRKTLPSRSFMKLPEGTVTDSLRAHGVRYVLLGGFIKDEDGRLADALKPECRNFRVEWNGLPAAVLLSVLGPDEHAQEACELIPAFQQVFAAPAQ